MKDEFRSPVSAISKPQLRTILEGTMRYSWRGVLCNKSPFDFALYSLLIWREKPETIIEIGTKEGGSTLWLFDLCRTFGLSTKIISIDVHQRAKIEEPGITLLRGNALNLGAALPEETMHALRHPLLVIDDSAHQPDTVLAILRFMDRYLREGEYAIIEDGICESMGATGAFKGGPIPGIRTFLAETNGRYIIDTELCDFFGYNVTCNANGYLRKIA
jgi:cephalosporin hydroxylase